MRYLLLLAAVLVVAAPTGAGTSARDLRVRAAGDGAPGSLRHLVEQLARPGDRIVIGPTLRIQLNRRLIVPRRLAGLTIDGGGGAEVTGAGGELRVDADRVTLRGLRLVRLPVHFATHSEPGAEVGPRRTRVVDVVSTGPVRGYSGLKLDFVRDFQIRGGRYETQILLTGTQGVSISGATLAAKGNAVSDENSDLLRIEANTIGSGRIDLASVGAAVARNTVAAGGTLHVRIEPGGSGRVDANRLAGGRIVAGAGGELRVGNNVVTGSWRRGPGLPGITVECTTSGKSPKLAVNGNTVTGMRIGISAACGRDVPIALNHNTLERNGTGILVSAKLAGIRGGKVSGNSGAGIRVLAGSRTTISQIAAGGNGGRAIERAQADPRPPKLEYDEDKDRIRGVTCAECIVELYAAEEGAEPGEGLGVRGTVRASSNGSFVYPATGTVQCGVPPLLTATATRPKGPARGTSEFSADLRCEPLRIAAIATHNRNGARMSYCLDVRVDPPRAAKGTVTLTGPSGAGTRAFELAADGTARVVFPITAYGSYRSTTTLLGRSLASGAEVGPLSSRSDACPVP